MPYFSDTDNVNEVVPGSAVTAREEPPKNFHLGPITCSNLLNLSLLK